ncbi:MAG: AAA family ATPase [Thermotogota bacterium]|nr:AAA family ATPase [Thermotogota bacterium]
MISHENIVNMAKDCNIKDEEWIVNILNKIPDISQQNRFSHQPFRIKKIVIKKFAIPEYGGVSCTPHGKNCLIWGSHRSGKSTTYDALLYGLLGKRAVLRPSIGKVDVSITLSNGSMDMKITRKYKKSLLVEIGNEPYEGVEATSILQEYMGIDPDDYRTFRGITLPQRSETDSILQLTNAKELTPIIERFGSDKKFSQTKDFVLTSLDEIETVVKQLEVQDLDMAHNETDVKQRMSSTKYQINQLKDYIKNYESGKLEKLVQTLGKNPEIKNQLQKLEHEFQQLQRKGLRLRRLVGAATHKYVDKTPKEVVENVLLKVVCPVCENVIDAERIQNRINNKYRCPLCNEPYSWDILDKAELKVEESKKVEEWSERIKEINQRKTEIDYEKKKINFEYSHETTRRVIKKQISEKDYTGVKEKLESANELLKDDEGRLKKLDLARRQNKEELNELKNKKDFIKYLINNLNDTKSLEKAEYEFENKINTIFRRITNSGTIIDYENGEMHLVEQYGSRERKRRARDKYDISVGEKRALDISIVLSLFLMNQESRYYNIDFIILDDVTEGIWDDVWKSNLIEIIDKIGINTQLVCTSYDKQIKQLNFSCEEKLKVQTRLDDW